MTVIPELLPVGIQICLQIFIPLIPPTLSSNPHLLLVI